MSFALVFPGQGSQHAGMLAALESCAAASATFDEAASVLGYDARTRDDEVSLRSTVDAQIGLFLCGVVSARSLAERGVVADIVAGHSIGAFAAAVCARVVPFDAALRAVAVRARAMESAFPRGYGMGVTIGVALAVVRAIVERERESGGRVYLANVNAPAQIVVSGELPAVDAVLDRCRAQGARRAERLPVAVPSHCELLEPVALAVRDALRDVPFEAPRCTYIGAMRARVAKDARDVRDDLCEGVAHSVQWEQAARLVVELGARLAVEAAPGRVLTDLWQPEDGLRAQAMEETRLESIVALYARSKR